MKTTESPCALPPPLGKYPRFRRAGELIYVSGVSARLPDGSIDGVSQENGVVCRDVRRQTQRVLQNVAEILASAGASLADCIDITVFLTDQQDFAAYNTAYGEYFESNGPARTTVIVRGLPHPDMVVEVKAVAWQASTR
jgi:2-aminomuconate deaminase